MHRSLFYPLALSSEEEEEARRLQGQTRRMLGVLRDQGDDGFSTAAMSDLPPLPGADSLDDIVSQNSHELQRRRSVGLPYGSSLAATARQTGGQDELPLSMMGFNNAFQGFQFGHDVAGPHADMASGLGGFVGLPAGQTRSSFPQPGFMTMSAQPDYATLSNVDMAALANSNMGPMGANPPSIDAFGTPDLGASYGTSAFNTANPDFSMDMAVDTLPLDSGISFGDDGGAMMGGSEAFNGTGDPREPPPPSMMVDPSFNRFQPNMAMARSSSSLPTPASFAASSSSASATPQHTSSPASVAQPSAAAPSPAPSSSSKQPATAAAAGPALPPGPAQHNSPQKKARNVYSRSGFDMLRALWYVATRKNPTLRIGAVDMSCSFVVCDVTLNDCPIVYVSDNFEKLTGYSRHEILGQNCRFLQSPTGKVEAGSRREFVENGAVFNLKRAMDERREIQQGIINYRKGGRPFLNLLTMVFIPWDDTPEGEIKYCVGFQIDLVECPEAVSAAVEAATGETERNGIVSVGGKDLEVEVDYRRVEAVGPYIKTTPPPLPATSSSREADLESGQTISVDDVSGLIQQLDPGGPSSDWHRHAWDKMLLENADDLVHVLSLKGLFLYLSPACKRLLEYDVGDLVGNSLSSVCHPSDIVPVMRELKEVQVNVAVNLVFRIRRKHSGYMWFESHGTLLGEQGKGRRCVMLVGRRRPVYALQRRDVDAHGGIGSADGEFWSKLSASGMFLFASSGVCSLLDLQPAELEGTSMHDLLRKESRDEFGRAVEKARRGAVVTLKHTLAHHRRGQPLQVQTTFYPGDASEPGQKNPSFLIAQTRAIKPPPRAIASSSAGGRSGGGATENAIMKGVITAEDSPAAPQPQDHQQLPTAATLEAEDDDNMFDELKTTRCTSWQYELRQMEKVNRLLAEELAQLMASKKKRKRRKRDGAGAGAAGGGGSAVLKDCANCHKRDTPEWRRGPSGNRDLCNSCGLRWAKQTGKVLPRTSTSRAGSVGTSADAQSNKRSGNSSPVLSPVSTTTTAGTGALPPQSNPLFGAGASGAGGLPMEMTAIWEAEEGREGGVGP